MSAYDPWLPQGLQHDHDAHPGHPPPPHLLYLKKTATVLGSLVSCFLKKKIIL